MLKVIFLYLCAVKLIQLNKIKVGIVNYLNTKPLLYGIEHSPVIHAIEPVPEYPAKIARMLLNDEIDMGLVPVAVIPRMKQYFINTNYCIGCTQPVASVCLFSDVPVEEITEVLMDYQSRTSVTLARILMRDYWKINPTLTNTQDDYRPRIKGTTAGVVIGDRALEQRKKSRYIYDLGEAWMAHTGLPFVFAAWVSNKPLPEDFIAAFDEANRKGLEHIDEVVAENPYDVYDLHEYYTKNISYELDDQKRAGLEKFLSLIREDELLKASIAQ
ncbi:menaquinone biosynthesis protein [Pseudoflavitalea sp. G-6-1-2]|nr:menaquinone biosynthesis protein [Pseudoflavitalea sp. G-6-1-2]